MNPQEIARLARDLAITVFTVRTTYYLYYEKPPPSK